ncbi:heterokaryon incompatibility protein-domain-containing protein, partial [Phaeosphaeriaceae sp. PMI808]
MQYFALSYVWGVPKPNTETHGAISPYSTQLLRAELPQVIQDAIQVVKNLREVGQRYLWVDKFCIDQNNLKDKHHQIKSMDAVYENAVATIVAASGDGADCGLPGVGPVPRSPQPTACTNGKRLVSTLPHVSIALKDTIWMSRGWTYQEAMLSRRCIVFTDLQVYFICRKSTQCEAMNKHDSLRAPGDELPSALFEPRVLSGPRIKGVLELFSDHVSQYTKRRLTQETDALDAFKGILAR